MGQNRGSISNCYSVTSVQNKKALSGGFVAENSGFINCSYSYSPLGELIGGFAGNDTGRIENSFFIHNEKPHGSKKLEKLADTQSGIRLNKLQEMEDYSQLGFNTTSIWEKGDSSRPLWFIPETWNLLISEEIKKEIRLISSAEELRKFAESVNRGEEESRTAWVRLTQNINLGGKEWTPIGKDKKSAFEGIFDGAGFTVSNFKVKKKSTELKGFFGYFTGKVYNLLVDCILSSGKNSGALVAWNDGGTVGCCGAVLEITGKTGILGGLVGFNNGTIFESYAAGRIAAAVLIWPLIVLPILVVMLTATIILAVEMIVNPPAVTALIDPIAGAEDITPGPDGSAMDGENPEDGQGVAIFAPVPYDADQVPIVGDTGEEPVEPNTDGNFVSFQFEQMVDVDLLTGNCSFNFKNPGNSNHNIVVQLHFTDAQAIRVMGSTGRTQEEQDKLEAAEGYDPETYRTILAESGAIRPGYELSSMKLITQPNGALLPPGNYNAVIYLNFYDIETNNKAMLESQLPVVITVH